MRKEILTYALFTNQNNCLLDRIADETLPNNIQWNWRPNITICRILPLPTCLKNFVVILLKLFKGDERDWMRWLMIGNACNELNIWVEHGRSCRSVRRCIDRNRKTKEEKTERVKGKRLPGIDRRADGQVSVVQIKTTGQIDWLKY